MKAEDKYKDFQNLKDIDDMTLRNLFVERNYVRWGIDNPDAEDIIILSDIIDGKLVCRDPDKRASFKSSTYQERMAYKKRMKELYKDMAVFDFLVPDDFEVESAKWELSFLNLSDVPNRYLRKKVEKYRKLCSKIINENRPTDKFLMEEINISNLTTDLQDRKWWNKSYYNDYYKSVFNWFKGMPPKSPVLLNINANIFISLIADLKDKKFIKNSKEFCYSYIANSFLFNGKKAKKSYIEKVMKPKSENRVSAHDKKIPDIQIFSTSS